MSKYFEDKLATFEQALKTFEASLLAHPSELERDGAIQRFEYCFDLSWKTLKQALEKRGILDLNSPRSVFAAAYAEKLIDDEVIWATIITKRNLSVDTYNQKLADSLFAQLPAYYEAMSIYYNNWKVCNYKLSKYNSSTFFLAHSFFRKNFKLDLILGSLKKQLMRMR